MPFPTGMAWDHLRVLACRRMVALVWLCCSGVAVIGCTSDSKPSASASSVASFPPSSAVRVPVTVSIPARPDISPVVEDDQALPDGTYYGFLRSIDQPGRTVSFDLMQHFIGDAAHQAESEDNAEQLDGYTRNPSEAVRILPVTPDVVVTTVGCCVYEGSPGTFDGLAASFLPGAAHAGDYSYPYRGPLAPYWLTVHAGAVTRIDEQYQA